MKRYDFDAIGTKWQIAVDDSTDAQAWQELTRDVQSRIQEFDRNYSRFRDDSLVTKISRQAGRYDLPADGFALMKFYERLYRATSGRLTPLVGQLMVDTGYDADYSFQAKKMTPAPAWEDVLSYDRHAIWARRPVLLDFGAAGKGYLVDIIGQMIEAAGYNDYFINAGGDIRHRSTRSPLTVGMENPLDASEVVGTVRLGNHSLCASAGSKRRWHGYHHIIDPRTLRSPEGILSTWVLAEGTMMADGLATALFFVPAERLRRQFAFEYAILRYDMTLSYSSGLPVKVFEVSHADD